MNPSLGMDFDRATNERGEVVWRVAQVGRETVEAPTSVEAYWLARKARRT